MRAWSIVAIFCLVLTSGAASAQIKPSVVVLSTGGTIASKHDPEKGGYVPGLSGGDLVAAIPDLAAVAEIRVEQVANISSSDVTPEIWLQLALRIEELTERDDVTAFVVTHGTNTLEETAYFLDLAVGGAKPIILVGAQRPASDPDSDGPRNLLDAVRVAVSPEASGMGALVVMNGEINAARDVSKTNTNRVEAFASLEFGPLGVVDADGARFYRSPLRRQTIAVARETRLGRVEILTSYAGADGELLRSMLSDSDVDGIVIAGLGLGSVPSAMVGAIKQAREKGVPVVVSTRVPTGRVFPLSANAGSAADLESIGCVLADNLSPQKARILLMLALTRTRDLSQLRAYFDR
jgi:L-asparaginase